MTRGTTVNLMVTIPEYMTFDCFYVTFSQYCMTVVEKTQDDCVLEGNMLIVPLTQEDTLKFRAGRTVSVQIRGTVNDDAFATKIVEINVDDVLKDGLIPESTVEEDSTEDEGDNAAEDPVSDDTEDTAANAAETEDTTTDTEDTDTENTDTETNDTSN